MTQDDILRMAREVGLPESRSHDGIFWDALERFAALVAATEREACAQACAEISKDYWMGDCQFEAATRCANAIRERRTQ